VKAYSTCWITSTIFNGSDFLALTFWSFWFFYNEGFCCSGFFSLRRTTSGSF